MIFLDMSNFLKKIEKLKNKFGAMGAPEKRYDALMQMGRALPPFLGEWKTPERKVPGCQSTLYLRGECVGGKIFFTATADALISAGLAALLIEVYSGETPETVLAQPPLFLEELGIYASLSPNRSHGLSSIHLKMKQEALRCLTENKS